MDDLDDPYSLSLMYLVMLISLNLIFETTEKCKCFKTHVIRRTRANVSAIMHELGKKSKNYYRMRDMSFWKLHDELKDEINKKPVSMSRRSRKKRKLRRFPLIFFSIAFSRFLINLTKGQD